MKPKCPLIAFPCAYGLMTLTQKYQNVKKAKNILKEMIPKHKTSGYGNLINAFYFEVFGKVVSVFLLFFSISRLHHFNF